MSEQSLNIAINYGLSDSFISPWLRLEQEPVADISSMATIEDVVSMLNLIKAGLSARLDPNTDCPIFVDGDGVAHYMTRVFVYLSDINMDYTLKISEGLEYSQLGPREILESLSKQESVVFNHSDSVSVDWMIDDFSYYWETPTYDKNLNIVSNPIVTFEGDTISLSKSVFGILRVVSTTNVHVYDLVISKSEGFKIENLACTLEAPYSYNDGEGTFETKVETLSLDIPECVEGVLAECENGEGLISRLKYRNNTDCVITKYYNVCTGAIVGHKDDCPDYTHLDSWDFDGFDDPQYGIWRDKFNAWLEKIK